MVAKNFRGRTLSALGDDMLLNVLGFCDVDAMIQAGSVSKDLRQLMLMKASLIVRQLDPNLFHLSLIERPCRDILFSDNLQNVKVLKILSNSSIILVRGFRTFKLLWRSLEWKRCPDTRRDRAHFSAIYFYGEIYAVGTISQVAAGTVERYNPIRDTWSSCPSLPAPLISVATATLGSTLYIIGGFDINLGIISDSVYFIDHRDCKCLRGGKSIGIDSLEWRRLDGYLQRPRSCHAAVAYKNKIWIAGGEHDLSPVLRSTEVYDPLLGTWMAGPCLVKNRKFGTLNVVNDTLYAVGGDVNDEGQEVMRTIEKLNDATGEWEFVTVFKQKRRGFSSCAIGFKICVFGGSDVSGKEREDGNYSDTWDAYDTVTGKWDSDLSGGGDIYKSMPFIDDWGQAVTVPTTELTWA